MKELASYRVSSEGVYSDVAILQRDTDVVNLYELRHTKVKNATNVALNYLKQLIVEEMHIKISEILDPRESERVKARLVEKAHQMVKQELQGLTQSEENIIVARLVQEMMGLGDLEILLADDSLEEIVVNSSREPVWVYHRKFGWLKTNVYVSSEEQIQNYAAIIGRKVGKQITNLDPLMDARLLTGDRVNAVLYPVSYKGHSITIRKFTKDPWTIIGLIGNHTISAEAAAMLWTAVQYESSILVGGGTASGKTSFLNALLMFCPPNQRIVSIEDTQELVLHSFLHWTPMLTRQPNVEGKGEVTMLDLLVNSLRMRPDRIVLGEIRRQREAEVLFEALHTGHSVYSTLHADDSAQTRSRLINPPINLPEPLIGALPLVVAQYRQRRTGIRRAFEVAEIIPKDSVVKMNIVYKWDARSDKLVRVGVPKRLLEDLSLHTGFTEREVWSDIREKQLVLTSMVEVGLDKVNQVGKIVAEYYRSPRELVAAARKNQLKNFLVE